jgi:hypothetical protein
VNGAMCHTTRIGAASKRFTGPCQVIYFANLKKHELIVQGGIAQIEQLLFIMSCFAKKGEWVTSLDEFRKNGWCCELQIRKNNNGRYRCIKDLNMRRFWKGMEMLDQYASIMAVPGFQKSYSKGAARKREAMENLDNVIEQIKGRK